MDHTVSVTTTQLGHSTEEVTDDIFKNECGYVLIKPCLQKQAMTWMYSAVYSLLTGLIQNLAQNTAHQEGLSIVRMS